MCALLKSLNPGAAFTARRSVRRAQTCSTPPTYVCTLTRAHRHWKKRPTPAAGASILSTSRSSAQCRVTHTYSSVAGQLTVAGARGRSVQNNRLTTPLCAGPRKKSVHTSHHSLLGRALPKPRRSPRRRGAYLSLPQRLRRKSLPSK